ncbi:hypothetical protein ACFSQ3_14540 [Sphingobacterium corticis]|uniref:Large polyvalent protein associated domain-containing protein n=1 Tax=Sphingobacterium corticis TaxID=1812823 RepID=A0ABW5NQ82_9SPHI
MNTLTFTYRNKTITAPMEVVKKHMSSTEYHLSGKTGQLYIFRHESTKWSLAYGNLTDELRECILDALIMQFEPHIVKTFIYKGERQIVTVGEVSGNSGTWHVMINHYYIGYLLHHSDSGAYSWHIHNGGGWIRPRHMDLFIDMLKDGKIKKR